MSYEQFISLYIFVVETKLTKVWVINIGLSLNGLASLHCYSWKHMTWQNVFSFNFIQISFEISWPFFTVPNLNCIKCKNNLPFSHRLREDNVRRWPPVNPREQLIRCWRITWEVTPCRLLWVTSKYTARLLFSEYLCCGWLLSSYDVPPSVTMRLLAGTRHWWYCEGTVTEVLRRYSVTGCT